MTKKQNLFDEINLQLFADTDDTDDIEEMELEDEGGFEFDIDDEEPDFEEEQETIDIDDDIEEEKPKPRKQNENVVGKAVQAERNKWKKRMAKMQEEIESIKSQTHRQADDDVDDELSKLLVDSGFDEPTAKKINGVLSKRSSEVENIKKSVASNFYKMEIKQLKADPLYADIEDYESEVISLANKTGLSVEQAYLAMFGKDKITRNIKDKEREIEQRVISNIQKRKSGSINTTSDGGTIRTKNQYKLSADEIEVARMAGMTPKEYYALKNYKTMDKINSVLDKKKK